MRWAVPLLALAILAGTWLGAGELIGVAPAAGVAVLGVCGSVWAAARRRRVAVRLAALMVAAAGVGAVAGARAIGDVRAAPVRAVLREELERPPPEQAQLVLEGRLRGDARASPAGVWFELDTLAVSRSGVWVPASGRVRVSVSGELAGRARAGWRDGRVVRCPVTVRDPQPFRNPGVPDQQRALARRGLALFASTRSAALVEVVAPASWWRELAASWRHDTRTRLAAAVGPWSPQSAGIVTAILTGDRTGLDEPTAERLRRAGTFHVIAISGGNVAMLAGVALGLARLLGAGPRGAPVVAGVAIAAYGAAVDGGPSVSRATFVAVVWCAARAFDQHAAPLHLLGLALGTLLLAAPLAVFDVGFALTFGATLGILTGVPVLAGAVRPSRQPGWPAAGAVSAPPSRWVRGAWGGLALTGALCAATLCAELAILPVGALAFGRVTWAGLVLNLAAIPAMAVAQFGGIAVLALGVASSGAAQAAGGVAHAGVWVLVESARLVEVWPWLEGRVTPPSLAGVATYYGAAAGAVLLRPGRWRAGAAGVLVAAVAGISGGWSPIAGSAGARAGPPGGWVHVTFLDVGQGSATLVQWAGGAMLVDAGGLPGSTFDVGARVVVPALRALGAGRLDALAVTHADPDHAGGAVAVVEELRPRRLLEGVPVVGNALRERVLDAAGRAGAARAALQAGERIAAGPAVVSVLSPPAPDWERRRVRNDDSLVLDVRLGDVSVLLMGDAGTAVEARLAGTIPEAPVRVMALGHHGSRDASGDAWLQAARPGAAIVSAGRFNRFGHPAAAVLERCRAAGVSVHRTDQLGAIRVRTDGRVAAMEHWDGRAWVPPSPHWAEKARGEEVDR
jgi:competence protein ComEC